MVTSDAWGALLLLTALDAELARSCRRQHLLVAGETYYLTGFMLRS